MSSNDAPAGAASPASDWHVDFIAGWCSGAVAVLACQPVDTVLTRLQAAVATPFGTQGLWRGSTVMIGAVPLQNALLMGGYGIGKGFGEGGAGGIFVGGCTGGILQSFVMSPVELVKVRQQITGGGAAAGAMMIPNMKGLSATFLRDGVPHGVWFVSYDWCKREMMNRLYGRTVFEDDGDDEQLPMAVPLTSGAFAATVAWGVGYPFDIIKTRIQASSSAHPPGVWATGKTLVAEANGNVMAGLYRGFTLKLLRSIPASMIGFGVYEWVAHQLRKSG